MQWPARDARGLKTLMPGVNFASGLAWLHIDAVSLGYGSTWAIKSNEPSTRGDVRHASDEYTRLLQFKESRQLIDRSTFGSTCATIAIIDDHRP